MCCGTIITYIYIYIYINVDKYEIVNVILMVDRSGGEPICVDWRGEGVDQSLHGALCCCCCFVTHHRHH